MTTTLLQLPDVTLIALTGKDFLAHRNAINQSCWGVEFGAVKIVWDKKISSIDEWNYRIIYELPHYVDTAHALLVHADGYVINPGRWRDEWLSFDYIGAPWPLPQDDYSYRDEEGNIVRVGNSISLRSKKLMDLVAQTPKDYFWSMKEKYGNTNEDGYICCHNRKWLESQGCQFAPIEQAIYFSKEHVIPENRRITRPFCFHSL